MLYSIIKLKQPNQLLVLQLMQLKQLQAVELAEQADNFDSVISLDWRTLACDSNDQALTILQCALHCNAH